MDKNKVLESRKYRIYPTEEQKNKIDFYIECNREMWNEMLNRTYLNTINKLKEKHGNKYSTKILYNTLKYMDYKEQKNLYKTGFKSFTPKIIYSEITKLKNVDVTLYGYTKRILKKSFENHFKNPKHFGMPKFKGFQETLYAGSYSTAAGKFCYFKSSNVFKISKVGDVEIVNHYPSNGRLYNVTVSRKSDDTYYVSLGFEQDVHTKVLPNTGKEVGIDFNVDTNTALSFSDEFFIQRPNVKKLLSKLDWESHKLGKKREKLKVDWSFYVKEHKDNPVSFSEYLKDCKNYQKNRLKVAKINSRIRNIYDYWIKTSASEIVKKYDNIAVEDLSTNNMLKNHKLARAIAQSHFRELRTTLEYKALWSGKKVISVDPRFTSQTCSSCGYLLRKEERLTLKDREWTCPNCGEHHIRDINAAKNILKKSKIGLTN